MCTVVSVDTFSCVNKCIITAKSAKFNDGLELCYLKYRKTAISAALPLEARTVEMGFLKPSLSFFLQNLKTSKKI